MGWPPTRAPARSWVLRASEKEPEGGERKGGGNGLGLRFAKRAMPVSKRKGVLGSLGGEVWAYELGLGSEEADWEREDVVRLRRCHAVDLLRGRRAAAAVRERER